MDRDVSLVEFSELAIDGVQLRLLAMPTRLGRLHCRRRTPICPVEGSLVRLSLGGCDKDADYTVAGSRQDGSEKAGDHRTLRPLPQPHDPIDRPVDGHGVPPFLDLPWSRETRPDRDTRDWMATDPTVHATLATTANADFAGQWKPVVKMIKKWNTDQGKPITPSFLIEVMSLELLTDWGGSYPRELKAWFATASEAIDEAWDDPAHLGHPVSDKLSADAGLRAAARFALKQAEAACTEAITQQREGRTGAALDTWQQLFGPAFAKS